LERVKNADSLLILMEKFNFDKQIMNLTKTEFKLINSLVFFKKIKSGISSNELIPNLLLNTKHKKKVYQILKDFIREDGWITHKLLAKDTSINSNAIPQKIKSLVETNIVEEENIIYLDKKNKTKRKLRVIRLSPIYQTLVFLEIL
jgi:predicted HTH transcriptional regulator